MARKRKVESSAAIVDESDKVLYSAFRNSANELSQLYSQAISHNKLSFEAGQRHALVRPQKVLFFFCSISFLFLVLVWHDSSLLNLWKTHLGFDCFDSTFEGRWCVCC